MASATSAEPRLCECGCGDAPKPGNRFIHGHQVRTFDAELRAKIGEGVRRAHARRRAGLPSQEPRNEVPPDFDFDAEIRQLLTEGPGVGWDRESVRLRRAAYQIAAGN